MEVLMTKKEIELAETLLSKLSPLCGGSSGESLRKYLRFKQEQKIKHRRQPFIPIFDTGFRSF